MIKTPLDLLLPYQTRWVNDPARFKLGCWSRQTGKDFSTAAEMVRDCMQTQQSTWMIAAPSERQAIESMNKCKEWAEAFDLAIADEIDERDGEGTLLKSSEILFSNGSRILAVPGRPDTVRGFSANLTLTEFAFFDDPDATWKAVLPSITNPLRGGEKRVRLISTPNGKSGRGRRFYELIRDNHLEPRADRKQKWSVHYLPVTEAVAQGLPVNIEELREGLDDAEGWAQEFMCEFLDSSSVLLPYDLIAGAESTEASEACDPSLFTSGRSLYCGIDFGRQNDPTVCVTLERLGDVLITREILVLRGMSSVDQQTLLETRIKAAHKVSFDYTGPGIGLGDHLARQHGEWKPSAHQFGRVELCTFTLGLKREIFPKLRLAFEPPVKLRIPVSVDLREDLHAMQQIVRNGEFTYAAPRTAEGHSDRCTALALAVRAAGDGRVPLSLELL